MVILELNQKGLHLKWRRTMKRFVTSKSFLITSVLFSLLFIVNLTATPDSTATDIIISILKSILAGVISGFLVGGLIFLVQKKKTL